jgi:hypothetical protein
MPDNGSLREASAPPGGLKGATVTRKVSGTAAPEAPVGDCAARLERGYNQVGCRCVPSCALRRSVGRLSSPQGRVGSTSGFRQGRDSQGSTTEQHCRAPGPSRGCARPAERSYNKADALSGSTPEVEALPSHQSSQYLDLGSLQIGPEKLLSVSAATDHVMQLLLFKIRLAPGCCVLGKTRRRQLSRLLFVRCMLSSPVLVPLGSPG